MNDKKSKYKIGDLVRANHSDFPSLPLKIIDIIYEGKFSSDEGYAYLTESIGWDQSRYDEAHHNVWIEEYVSYLMSRPDYFFNLK